MPDAVTGRRRNPATHDAILEATCCMLEEIGFDKLSLEGVAARAGVGKATIYRWWSNKSVLAMEALLREAGPHVNFPDTASARKSIETQFRKVARLYRGKSGRVACDMIRLAQVDDDTTRLFNENYLEPRRMAARAVLRKGIAQHEFRSDLDLDIVYDLLYSPLLARMLMRHASIDDKQLNLHLKLVLDGIAA